MKRKKKRRPNAGTFKPGPDSRRHRFSVDEQRRGYRAALESTAAAGWALHGWLFRRVRGHYRASRREAADALAG